MHTSGARYTRLAAFLVASAMLPVTGLSLAQDQGPLGTCQRFRGTVGGEVQKDREGLGTCLRFRGCEEEAAGAPPLEVARSRVHH